MCKDNYLLEIVHSPNALQLCTMNIVSVPYAHKGRVYFAFGIFVCTFRSVRRAHASAPPWMWVMGAAEIRNLFLSIRWIPKRLNWCSSSILPARSQDGQEPMNKMQYAYALSNSNISPHALWFIIVAWLIATDICPLHSHSLYAS